MIHTLLYGKRGSGKSKIMEYAEDIAQISQFADAQNATSAGLTATASQTSKLQGEGEQWVIIAGTIPQAHGGVAFIDELDKAERRNQEVLATPMASGRTVIKKAGEAELPSQTSIVSAANSETETYRGEAPIKSLDIPVHIRDRFDVILRVDDEIRAEDDEREILEEIACRKAGDYDVPYDKATLREHIAYAKQKRPEMSEAAEEAIIDRILDLRMAYREADLKGIEMTGREQEKLTRLSSAMAKLRLGSVVTVEDVERAWTLMKSAWQSITFSEFDFDEEDSLEDLMTAVSMAQTPSQQQVVRQTIGVVDVARNGSNTVPADLVYEGVDASEGIIDWSLDCMEDEGMVNVDGDIVEVVDL
jgi:DNA replicative helicase MCM subunit Mcm2 (Cdc46/Mcm family)